MQTSTWAAFVGVTVVLNLGMACSVMGPLERSYLKGVRFTEPQKAEPIFEAIWRDRQRQPREVPGVLSYEPAEVKPKPVWSGYMTYDLKDVK